MKKVNCFIVKLKYMIKKIDVDNNPIIQIIVLK